MKRFTVALIILVGLSNVADAGSLFSKQPKDYGAAISQSRCEAIARRNVEPYLRNPRAARYRWGKCEAQTMKARVLQRLAPQSGYGMQFFVDSTNKWGKYTGYVEYEILIRDGKVIRRLRRSDRGAMQQY